MIGAVGVELSLQTHALPVVVSDPALAGGAALQEIGCVALNAGQGGLHLQGNARLVTHQAGSGAQGAHGPVDDPVVVVAPAPLELRERTLDALTDGVGIEKVHGGTDHFLDLPCGDAAGHHGGVVGGVEDQNVVQNGAAVVAVEVKVGCLLYTSRCV